jgi:tetratricopeptide (TPR) repeat protein
MRNLAFLLFILVFSLNALAQGVPAGFDLSNYGVKVEPDKRLMVVLATLEAARDDKGSNRLINTILSPAGTKFRNELDSDLTVPDDLRQKISTFVIQYKKRHPQATDAETVAPFISMAYSLSPVPDLSDPVVTSDLPGSLLDVLDFAPLVREFYRQSGIAAKLDQYTKEYQAASDAAIRPSARDMVSELMDYLHTRPQTIYTEKVKTVVQKGKSKNGKVQQIETREHERRFFFVPEMLAPTGNTNFLNIRDDYYVIIPPDTDLRPSDARRAFLQFVVDPLVLTNAKDISTVQAGIKQLLDERRKINPNVTPDVFLAIGRSMVAAIDARELEYERVNAATLLARRKIETVKTAEEKKAVSDELNALKQSFADETAVRLSDEYERGSVLAFYFADQLKGLEDSGFDVASSMRDMILSLNATKETNRLEQYAEARKRGLAARAARRSKPEMTAVENPLTARLIEIQKMIDAKDYTGAGTGLKQLLQSNPNEARIYYSLGLVASLTAEGITDQDMQKAKLLEAKNAYEKVIDIAAAQLANPATRQSVDLALASRTYVALAKIYEFYDDTEYAKKIYDMAIKIGNINGGAYAEAIAAKQRLLKNP